MVQNVFYIVSSIIMPGGEDRKTLTEARIVAKQEAIKLSKTKQKGSDNFVTIDKYNTRTGINILLEEWKYTKKGFISNKIGVIYK